MKTCPSCRRHYADPQAWRALPLAANDLHPDGRVDYGEGDHFELRNCACGSTIAIPVTLLDAFDASTMNGHLDAHEQGEGGRMIKGMIKGNQIPVASEVASKLDALRLQVILLATRARIAGLNDDANALVKIADAMFTAALRAESKAREAFAPARQGRLDEEREPRPAR